MFAPSLSSFNAILNRLQSKIMMIMSTRLYRSPITVPIQWPCLFGEFWVEQNDNAWYVRPVWRCKISSVKYNEAHFMWLPLVEPVCVSLGLLEILQELRMLTLIALWGITLNVTFQDLEQVWEYWSLCELYWVHTCIYITYFPGGGEWVFIFCKLYWVYT